MGFTISSVRNNSSSNLFEAEQTGLDQNLQSSESTPSINVHQLPKNIIEDIFKDTLQRDFIAISQVNKQCRRLAHFFIKQIKCSQSIISKKKLCKGLKIWNIQDFKSMSINTCIAIDLSNYSNSNADVLKWVAINFTSIKILYLSQCPSLNRNSFKYIARLTYLTHLDLSNNFKLNIQYLEKSKILKGL